ncbi:Scopoletin glucosyltransferase [Bienertia sinuspersici]
MVKKEAIKKALREIMVGDEAKQRRARAKKLKEMAQKAVEDGGSSYSDLSVLINELRVYNSDNKISNQQPSSISRGWSSMGFARILFVLEIVRVHEPFKNVSSDKEPFVLPFLPDEIQLTRLQILEELQVDGETKYKKRMDNIEVSELESYGVIVNSFYELEPEYADFFREELGRSAWNIGPFSLRNRSREDKGQKGKQASIDEHGCMKWLNSKKPNSAIYICFGSTISFIAQQLPQIAMALEAAEQEFIRVVKNGKSEEWLPTGFEQRIGEKGLLIRRWAPQVLILEHEAIGAFVTHCGWNSTLEAISAEKALRDIMVGKEVEDRRARAKKLKETAQKAVEEGGSSYSELTALINEVHVVFFPLMAHGHMIPTLDIARLFAARDGIKATIITTPLNAITFNKSIGRNSTARASIINIEEFRFPAEEVGLPQGFENLEQVLGVGLTPKFFKAAQMLQEQLEQYLEKVRPSCLVADMFFPWATESAAIFNIPRLVFQGTSSFSLCAQEIIRLNEPFKNVSTDEEPFVLPSLPHEIQFTRLQISEDLRKNEETEYKKRMAKGKQSEIESYGVIVNSFYELEPDYADFYREQLGRRAWNIGPVSLNNRCTEEKTQRGKQASINEHECLQWLASKKPNSVIYICFGSNASFITPQLHEIAMALEESGKEFVWVIRVSDNEKSEEKLPTGFEQRMEEKGLIIRGWAPQMIILEHEAIGAFVTHCGWNSTLEGISAGVPMVTWPLFAEQFYNEKLVTQILKMGISVGAQKWSRTLQ